jgi:hypothetical protein
MFMRLLVTSDFDLGLVMIDATDGVMDGRCPYPMVFLDAYFIFYSISVPTLFVCCLGRRRYSPDGVGTEW